MKYIVLFLLVFMAGFVDSVAGGGGLISLPAYMLAGFPVHQAIATNKMSSCMGTTVSTYKYAKSGYVPVKQIGFYIVCAFVGSTLGAKLALLLNERYFKILMIFILPVVLIYVLKSKTLFKEKEPHSFKKTVCIGMVIALFVGAYDGFYGPGTGTFLILLFTGLAHIDVKSANGAAKVINLTTNIASLIVYLLSGNVVIITGMLAGCFNVLGNYIGAHFFIKKDVKFVRYIIMVVLTIFIIKVLTELVSQ